MSAIGSVIVMVRWSSLFCGFPRTGPSAVFGDRAGRAARRARVEIRWVVLPGGLGDAGELAAVSHLPQADPAQAELAVDGLRTAATLAAGVAADRELRLAGRL